MSITHLFFKVGSFKKVENCRRILKHRMCETVFCSTRVRMQYDDLGFRVKLSVLADSCWLLQQHSTILGHRVSLGCPSVDPVVGHRVQVL